MTHETRAQHVGVRLWSIFLLTVSLLGVAAVGDASAQEGHTLEIHAVQCPPGYVGSMAEEHCEDAAVDVEFLAVGGTDASGMSIVDVSDEEGNAAVTGEDGVASFGLSPEVNAVRIVGPPFFVSTLGPQPRPTLQVRCFDDAGNSLERTGGDPGTSYTLTNLPAGTDIRCDWYIGADTSPVSAWQGGYPDNVAGFYPGSFVSLYGANSDYPSATLTFELDEIPTNGVTLEVTGLDDELEQKAMIEATLNGTVVYTGSTEFPNWFPGMEEPGMMRFDLPADLLQTGQNSFQLRNLEPAANYNAPPYVLVGETRLIEKAAP